MIKKLKKLTVQMVAGANVVTVIVMLLLGYSDHLRPVDHPILSTFGMAFPIFLLINLVFLIFWLVFKWRYAWIPVAGYLLAYVPISIYMPLHRSQEVPDGAIKLISYNVCGFGGNHKYKEGFEMIHQYLHDEHPDIVCIQEANDPKRKQVLQELAKTFAYNDTMLLFKTAKNTNALGIHTRFPILHRERIEYPSTTNGSVAWWLKVDDDTLIVVNNHFESCHLDSMDRKQYRYMLKGEMSRDSVRAESKHLLVKLAEANAKRTVQIETVRNYVVEHSQYPIIVCGDFNDNPISYSRHTMSEVLTDCYAKTGWGIGLSFNQKAFSFRIDHVFCSEKLTPYNCKVDDNFDASDHFPVICWLKMRSKH